MNKRQKCYLPFKRLIGIIGSIVGIFFCMTFIWWWVTIINLFVTKGHPFFISKRVGKNGKEFGLLKFRSMKAGVDPNLTSKHSTKDNLTKFGVFLRKSSLDETLQLFNIFIGQMAFIGPRPLIDIDEDAITIQKRKENGSIALRPGISGYAQLHTRANLDCVQKADYDSYYFKHISLWFDIKVFIKTLFTFTRSNQGK